MFSSRIIPIYLFLIILFGISLNAQSQQKLNLDFEKLSVEGVSRPWGWAVYSFAPEVAFICDSTVAASGKHSLKISSDQKTKNSRFELSFVIEPSQILNSKISIDGLIKSENFVGSAGINLQSIGVVTDEYGTLTENTVEIKESENWEKYNTEIDIDGQPHSVLLTLYFQGSGTVWFDNLSFKVNGKAVEEVPAALKFTKEQQKTLTTSTSAFRTVEPTSKINLETSDFSDLEYLKTIVKDSKIIALGESTHGTSEFFKVKHRILQYGILELGVRVFILEDNQLVVEGINEYVLYGIGEAETVIKGLFNVWNTEEMLQLIKWVRAYNIAHPMVMVEFVGMDVQNPQLALNAIDEFLKQKDSELQKKSNQLLSDINQEWSNSYFKDETVLIKWDRDAEENHTIFLNNKSKWLRESKNKSDSLKVEWAVKNARSVKQFVESALGGNYEGRDKAMAENVKWIISQRSPSTRVVIWAHDSHVSRGDSKDAGSNFFSGQSMGSYLSKEYKSDYSALGLFTYQGKCLGTISYSNFNQIDFEIYTSPVGSLDEGLHQVSSNIKEGYLMMNLRPFRNDPSRYDWLNIKRPVRYVGYVAEDYGFGGRYSIPYQFDGIIFIDKSTAATKINSK
jgi:erythromycin esterase